MNTRTIMPKPQVAATRQVLMNELGLTREIIREEMIKIVEAESKKLLKSLLNNNYLQELVKKQFNELLKVNRWDTCMLTKFAVDAANAEAREFIKNNLTFSVNNVRK